MVQRGYASLQSMNYNADSVGNDAIAKTKTPRPTPMRTKGRGHELKLCGQRSKRTIHRCASCVPTSWWRTRKTNCTAAQRIAKSQANPVLLLQDPWRRSQGHETTIRRNSAAKRITTNIKNIMPTPPPRNNMHTKGRATVQTTTRTTAASPDTRRRHRPNIAHRRHQHKAPCIVPLPGAAAATHDTPQTKATLPCINAIQSGVALFFIATKIESGPNGIRVLRHQSASNSSLSSSPVSTS